MTGSAGFTSATGFSIGGATSAGFLGGSGIITSGGFSAAGFASAAGFISATGFSGGFSTGISAGPAGDGGASAPCGSTAGLERGVTSPAGVLKIAFSASVSGVPFSSGSALLILSAIPLICLSLRSLMSSSGSPYSFNTEISSQFHSRGFGAPSGAFVSAAFGCSGAAGCSGADGCSGFAASSIGRGFFAYSAAARSIASCTVRRGLPVAGSTKNFGKASKISWTRPVEGSTPAVLRASSAIFPVLDATSSGVISTFLNSFAAGGASAGFLGNDSRYAAGIWGASNAPPTSALSPYI